MTDRLLNLAVVIPARNERGRVVSLLAALDVGIAGCNRPCMIVVDDGSTDDTGALARAAGAVVLRHRVNLGKGAARLTGCEAAVRLHADLIVLMDADGQHEPHDLPRLVDPLVRDVADVSLGSRRLTGAMPTFARFGNHLLNMTIRFFFGLRIKDTQCGYRAFQARAFPQLRWQATDYAVESEMLIRMERAGLRSIEVPIATIYHDRYKGTQPLDGLRILRQLIMWRLGA